MWASLVLISQASAVDVAVIEASENETSADLAAQLNDDTWFDFEAIVVTPEDVDEASELAAFDVVILGGSGQPTVDWSKSMVAEIDAWVRGGGGLLAVSWFHYSAAQTVFESDMDPLVPITLSNVGYEYCSRDGGTLSIVPTSTPHPITDGIVEITTESNYTEISSQPLPKGATSLMTATGANCGKGPNHTVAVHTVDDGRVAYLGPLFSAQNSYNNADLRSGDADRLLEQAVAWAADRDGDGFLAPEDCDDSDAMINPGAYETWYDGVDSDCDGASDYDQDLDGYDSDEHSGDDCDDVDGTINPAATETWYDGIDGDCDGASDYDQDLDGFDSTDHGGDDCNDLDDMISPAAVDTPYDGVDSDCSGGSDNDSDGDGVDAVDQGGADCDDTDPSIYEGAAEVLDDGIDQDCNGEDEVSPACGCQSAGPQGPALLVLMVGALALVRRRRQ